MRDLIRGSVLKVLLDAVGDGDLEGFQLGYVAWTWGAVLFTRDPGSFAYQCFTHVTWKLRRGGALLCACESAFGRAVVTHL